MPTTAEKRKAYRELHNSGCFVVPNPWDIGSARYLQSLGFKALASTSAGYAFSLGLPDNAVSLDMILAHLRDLSAATDVPVNADFEGGYAHDTDGVAKNVTLCAATGVAGLSIEDSTGDKAKPLYDLDTAVARVRAARAAIDRVGGDVVFTARAECFLVGQPDLDETIKRLKAYADAGADCLYSPGIRTPEQIAAVVKAVAPKPFNFLMTNYSLKASELAALGVRRISTGGTLARVAYGAMLKAARQIMMDGNFGFFAEAVPHPEINGFSRGQCEAKALSGDRAMRRMPQLLKLLDIELPIVLAPMAGNSTVELTAAVSNAGGLGSHACAMLSVDQVVEESARVRALTNRSFNLNFFCHKPPGDTREQEREWLEKLLPYYKELGVAPATKSGVARQPFDAAFCDAVLKVGPRVASFHFGMPEHVLVQRMKDAGIVLLASATTSAEAKRVVDLGADVVIAQGFEAGGHRGIFLSKDRDIANQVGTLALVPQVVDAVDVPVIAAGGIADARGAAAAFALGAAAVQVGTAYLFCPEAKVTPMHRAALKSARDESSVLTTVFTGRPARGIVNRVIREVGPMNEIAPAFPNAANAIAPLRAEAEKRGSGDFSPLWSGQAASLAKETTAATLTKDLASGARDLLRSLGQAAG